MAIDIITWIIIFSFLFLLVLIATYYWQGEVSPWSLLILFLFVALGFAVYIAATEKTNLTKDNEFILC